jgi:hypothetical protein
MLLTLICWRCTTCKAGNIRCGAKAWVLFNTLAATSFHLAVFNVDFAPHFSFFVSQSSDSSGSEIAKVLPPLRHARFIKHARPHRFSSPPIEQLLEENERLRVRLHMYASRNPFSTSTRFCQMPTSLLHLP